MGFGITDISGTDSHGSRIRVRMGDGGKKTFRLRVSQVSEPVMTWSGGLPLGLLKVVPTFTLTDFTGITHLSIRDTARGPLRGLFGRTMPDTGPAQARYVAPVKFRAELLSLHVEGALFPRRRSLSHPGGLVRQPELAAPR